MRLLTVSALLLILTVACSKKPTEPSGGDVVMTLNSDTYETNDTIVLTITNNLDHSVLVAFCPGAEPQKQDHDRWDNVWPPPEICQDMLPPELAAGKTMTLYFEPDWGHGTFRFVQSVFEDKTPWLGRAIYSTSFRVK
jgi:hypothetical protein